MGDITWKFPWHLALIFTILCIGVITLSRVYHQRQVESFYREQEAKINAVADFKVKAIVNWRQERMHDAKFILDDHFFALEVQNWLDGKSPEDQEGEIRQRLAVLKQDLYEAVTLTDCHGAVRLSIPEDEQEIDPQIKMLALDAIRTGDVVVSDLYFLWGGNEIVMSVAIPVHFEKKGRKTVVGTVLLRIDPERVLYPLILSWPDSCPSAEIAMMKKENNSIVYLNELRYHKDAALKLRVSLDELKASTLKSSQEYEGVAREVDYRGMPVLAATRRVPDSPWFIKAKIDESEISAQASPHFEFMLFLILSLIAASGFGVAYFWRNRDVHLYRRQYEAELERSAIARRYEYLTKYANDIIFILDKDQKIIEANDRAVEIYGYRREELIGQHIGCLSAQGRLPSAALPAALKDQNGLTRETLHRRKDETTFPVEISSSVLQIGEERFYQQIVRDLSGKKQREKALEESERQLRSLTAKLLSAQEHERSNLALMLHDELGQGLVYCKFRLIALKKGLRKAPRATLAQECTALLSHMDEILEYTRSLSKSLNIPALEELGFIASVRHLLVEFSESYGIDDCSLDLEAVDAFLPRQTQTHVFRVIQECLMNIARHSGASRVSLSIKKQNDHVLFIIKDNGAGFELEPVLARNTTNGLGISSMRERILICGGTFTIWSETGRGVCVQFTVPLSQRG